MSGLIGSILVGCLMNFWVLLLKVLNVFCMFLLNVLRIMIGVKIVKRLSSVLVKDSMFLKSRF